MHHTLTAFDRCDRCGARARAVTQHTNGVLMWCKHHYEEHEDALTIFLVYYATETESVQEPVRA